MSMLSPQDPFPRQQSGVATRLILSASAANDPERLKRAIERWRGGAGVMAGRSPHSLGPSNMTAPERERGGHHPSPIRSPLAGHPLGRTPALDSSPSHQAARCRRRHSPPRPRDRKGAPASGLSPLLLWI